MSEFVVKLGINKVILPFMTKSCPVRCPLYRPTFQFLHNCELMNSNAGQTRMFNCMSVHNNGELCGIGAILTGLLLSADAIKYAEANRTWGKTKYLLASNKLFTF